MQWYKSIDRKKRAQDLASCISEATTLNLDLEAVNESIVSNQKELSSLAPRVGTLFNPQNWFDDTQRMLRRERYEIRHAREKQKTEKLHIEKQLESVRRKTESTAATIHQYDAFDAQTRANEANELDRQISATVKEAERIGAQKNRVDVELEPILREMRLLSSGKQAAQSKRCQAADLLNQLSIADSPYERALVHEECESEFGVGSPQKVISQQEREITRIDRDYEKAQKRARETGEKALRTIDTVIIDGNNLCYEGDQFIGLSALEAIVPMLKRNHAVTIVFDAAIRRMLQTDDLGIKQRFGSDAHIHVVAAGNKADETIWDLAAKNTRMYILSNDRFGDFNEKEAVRGRRLIRHEIVGGQVFVHDLSLRVNYRGR